MSDKVDFNRYEFDDNRQFIPLDVPNVLLPVSIYAVGRDRQDRENNETLVGVYPGILQGIDGFCNYERNQRLKGDNTIYSMNVYNFSSCVFPGFGPEDVTVCEDYLTEETV
jgi:hypothetical protein